MQLLSTRCMTGTILGVVLMAGAQRGMTQTYGGIPIDALPRGVHLQAGGAAFFGLEVTTRTIYVGEAVPVDIEVGLRQGSVGTLNGLPLLQGGDFTLNRLSKRTETRKTFIQGSYFDLLTWHAALTAVKPGEFSLSARMPLSLKITASSAARGVPASRSVAKDVVIESAPFEVRVLPLPTEGRPQKFNGAVGAFQISSDVSPISLKQGEPLTLRLHVRGKGNFDRVESAMLDHLDDWKTYPVKSAFTPSDAAGDRGEKVFEQSLIATAPGEHSIPGFTFDYFNPGTRRYERAETRPINVMVAAPMPGGSLAVRASAQAQDGAPAAGALPGLRPDHPSSRATVGELRPLYFQGAFLALSTALALLLAGGWFAARPNPARASSKAAARVLVRLDVAARTGDALSFFEAARKVLVQTLAERWQMPAEQITGTELRMRLGTAGEDVERLFAIADEAKYSGGWSGGSGTDFRHWLRVIRGQLAGGRQ